MPPWHVPLFRTGRVQLPPALISLPGSMPEMQVRADKESSVASQAHLYSRTPRPGYVTKKEALLSAILPT